MRLLYLFKFLIIFFFYFNISIGYSQNINIPDGIFFSIKENTKLKIPDNLNVGKGTSGTINMDGSLIKVFGTMNLNSGSKFNYYLGDLEITTTNYNINSSFVFKGDSQIVMNHQYGNLAFEGTGNMQITGTSASPTTCNNLTIEGTGNIVEISENKALTINGTLINNGQDSSLLLTTSNSGDGSLIFSTNNVNGRINRYCSSQQWHYVSSPISNKATADFNTGYLQSWDASSLWTGGNNRDPWSKNLGTNMGIAQGYAYYSSDDTIQFEGLMNVSNYNITLLKNSGGLAEEQGWNFVGNPYTSAIDWDVAVADGAVPIGAENAIYFYDDDGTGVQSNYRYYVPSTGGTYGIGTSDATKNIPIGQGFFVKTNTNNVTLKIKNTYRIHNNQNFYKSQQNSICRIKFNANNKSDEAILRIVDDATINFDANYDARKILISNDSFPQIYFLNELFQDKMVINSIQNIENSLTIPIGIKAVEGNYSFSINELNIYAENIYLLDSKNNTKTKIYPGFVFNFYHEGGIVNNRFSIVFSNNSTNLNNYDDNNIDISIFPNPTCDLISISGIPSNSDVLITNVTGKIIRKFFTNNNFEKIDLSPYSDGIYLLKIYNNNFTYIKKIIKN